ncbi:MAG TPA: sugar ABC transporter ATP-binding protein [Planctomycetota bacterium]|nr:sugar ABC transporter ATP-binding protein [Planctomycetota bacterium]
MNSPLLEVQTVTKRFPGVLALRGVSLTLGRGEVLAVVGENGAGKSTLMKILAGVQTPDTGRILIDGVPVSINSCRAAASFGIALIHQELNLADNLDVGANIFLGREPRKMGFVDKKEIYSRSKEVLARVGLDVSPDTIVETLSIGQQQMVEIAKALSANARVLIMDEPTSSLSSGETEALFRVVKDLRSKGVSIVYISHRLGEVKELADRVTVLRDGQNAGELQRAEICHDAMVRLMVGRDLSQFYARTQHAPGKPVLEVRNLVTPAWPKHALNFSIRAGEVVGLAGLVGAGRTELLRVLFGVDRALGGSILIDGKAVELKNPMDAIRSGVALVPEDRKQQGLVLEMAVRENLTLPGLQRNQRAAGFLNKSWEQQDAISLIEKLRIKTPTPEQAAQFLSGGNQQKIVVGKWLALHPKIFLLDEPTRGVDIGARQEIYKLMESLAEKGMAILFASSDMEEVLGMSDRTLVMHEGSITGELQRSELSEEAVMRLATGGHDPVVRVA